MYQGGLGFGDGFKFGCGFTLASFVAMMIMGIVVAVLSLLAGLAGLGAMLPYMQNTM